MAWSDCSESDRSRGRVALWTEAVAAMIRTEAVAEMIRSYNYF